LLAYGVTHETHSTSPRIDTATTTEQRREAERSEMKPKSGGPASERRLLSRRILILCFLSFFLGMLVTDL
jgi:hypothetical protein